MKKYILIFFILIFLSGNAYANPIYGCTENNAKNYSSMVTEDDGSCIYESGINQKIFDEETYVAILEIEGIIMVLLLFYRFWVRLFQIRIGKRNKNFI